MPASDQSKTVRLLVKRAIVPPSDMMVTVSNVDKVRPTPNAKLPTPALASTTGIAPAMVPMADPNAAKTAMMAIRCRR